MQAIAQTIGIVGEIKAKAYDQSTLSKAQKLFNKAIIKLRDKYPKIMKFYILGDLKWEDKKRNIICNAGLNAITKLLTGDFTYTGEINKAILGTGTGTPAVTDTQLFTETYRNDQASGTDSSNIAYLTAYFTETEVSGTFTEFGNAIGGTATANTGQLWSHIASISWVKDTSTVLVVTQKYTFASV